MKNRMNLTRERALELHRQMWTDMQEALGDNPSKITRCEYKENWIKKHFPNDSVSHDCFLCEYCCEHQFSSRYEFEYDFCKCPIKWPFGRCEDGDSGDDGWWHMPISKLLALPERGDEEIEEKIEEEPAEMKDGLYLCDLQYSAEGDCTGYMYLTKQEYETVKKVADTCNWQNVCDEGYAGSLSIYCKKLEVE